MRSLKKFVFSLVAFCITLVVVLFALSNRQAVDLAFWPLPFSVATPVYLALAGAFLAGFLVGGAAMWVSDSRIRSKARERGRTVKTLERKMSGLEQELDKAQTRLGGPQTGAAVATVPTTAGPTTTLPVPQ